MRNNQRLRRKEIKIPERLLQRCEQYIHEKGLFSFNELVRVALFLLLEEKPTENARKE